MEVTKQMALRQARALFPGRRVLKIEPYYDNDQLNMNDYTTDWSFGKSDVFYYGNLSFHGVFMGWDTYVNYSASGSPGKKLLITADKYAISDAAWDTPPTYSERNACGSMVWRCVPLMLWQWDQGQAYQFQGWKITLVSVGPYLINVSLGGGAPTVDNILRDVSYANGYDILTKIDTTSFEMKSGATHWAISIRLPKHMASFGANYTLTNGTLVSATVDGSYWIAVISGTISSGTVTIQDIS